MVESGVGSSSDRKGVDESRSQEKLRACNSRGRLASAAVVAVILFVIVNLAAAAYHFGNPEPINFPELSWTAWAVKDFIESKARPNVVFLGSSLVLVPVAGADADYLGERVDGTQHHRSIYFEHEFEKKTGLKASTFNFALPGEMPSDAYLITRFLLKGDQTPDVIIYGLGPRDFMDNLLPSPASTDPFKKLARFGSISNIASRAMPDWLSRLDFELGKCFYLMGKKQDLTARAATGVDAVLDRLVPVPENAEPFTVDQRRAMLPDYKPVELGKGQAYFRPVDPDQPVEFLDNVAEYRKRYKKVKWNTFVAQMEFLTDVLDLARQRGSHVVVVAMPITDINRQLIKAHAWDAYLNSIQALAASKGASFFDLNSSDAFEFKDFMDTVHLHSGGGKKWLDQLVARLSDNDTIKAALSGRKDGVAQSSKDSAGRLAASGEGNM